jgi:hypothetical protein
LKCHTVTPSVGFLNKQKCLFSKTKDWKVKWIFSEGWCQWEVGGYREGVEDSEYGGNIM